MAGGNAIRGSRVGAGPIGEAERGESAPRHRLPFWCANGHETRIAFASDADVPELTRLAHTVDRWRDEILAFHTTGGCSNGPTEAVNLLIKKVKRVGHGFRNFDNYRLLLHCGVTWQVAQTASLRGRSPRRA